MRVEEGVVIRDGVMKLVVDEVEDGLMVGGGLMVGDGVVKEGVLGDEIMMDGGMEEGVEGNREELLYSE